jgi:hypothetical protein
MLLGAIGMQSLFRYWYDLFPRNPYARVFGLLPLLLLIASVINLNYQRYFTGVPYARASAQQFNSDALILHETLTTKTYRDHRIVLVTSPERKALYQIDSAIAKNLQVVTATEFVPNPETRDVIVDSKAAAGLAPAQTAHLSTSPTLLVNDRKDDALRFRIYSQ